MGQLNDVILMQVEVNRTNPESVYEVVDGLYCPISNSETVTGVHRDLVKTLKGRWPGLLEVCDLDAGELYFAMNNSYSVDLIELGATVKKLMLRHDPEWDGALYTNQVSKYENPLGVKAWGATYFTITRAPSTYRETD